MPVMRSGSDMVMSPMSSEALIKRSVPSITIPEKPVTNIFVPGKKKDGKVSKRKLEVRKAKVYAHKTLKTESWTYDLKIQRMTCTT